MYSTPLMLHLTGLRHHLDNQKAVSVIEQRTECPLHGRFTVKVIPTSESGSYLSTIYEMVRPRDTRQQR